MLGLVIYTGRKLFVWINSISEIGADLISRTRERIAQWEAEGIGIKQGIACTWADGMDGFVFLLRPVSIAIWRKVSEGEEKTADVEGD